MQYIIKNKITGKIDHFCIKDNALPDGAIKVENWVGIAGEPNEYYDDLGNRYSDEVLTEKGIIEDHRGTYYHKESKQEYENKNIRMKMGDNWVTVKPAGVPYEKWNGSVWEEDLGQKAEYDKNIALGKAQSYLASTDFYFTIDKYAQLTDEKKLELEMKREEARKVIRGFESE